MVFKTITVAEWFEIVKHELGHDAGSAWDDIVAGLVRPETLSDNSHVLTGVSKLVRLKHTKDRYTVLYNATGDVVGGYMLLRVTRNRCCRLFLLDVFARFRRQGYGRRLLQHAVSTAAQTGLPTLKITGAKGARMFYEACGLTPDPSSTSNRDQYIIHF